MRGAWRAGHQASRCRPGRRPGGTSFSLRDAWFKLLARQGVQRPRALVSAGLLVLLALSATTAGAKFDKDVFARARSRGTQAQEDRAAVLGSFAGHSGDPFSRAFVVVHAARGGAGAFSPSVWGSMRGIHEGLLGLRDGSGSDLSHVCLRSGPDGGCSAHCPLEPASRASSPVSPEPAVDSRLLSLVSGARQNAKRTDSAIAGGRAVRCMYLIGDALGEEAALAWQRAAQHFISNASDSRVLAAAYGPGLLAEEIADFISSDSHVYAIAMVLSAIYAAVYLAALLATIVAERCDEEVLDSLWLALTPLVALPAMVCGYLVRSRHAASVGAQAPPQASGGDDEPLLQ